MFIISSSTAYRFLLKFLKIFLLTFLLRFSFSFMRTDYYAHVRVICAFIRHFNQPTLSQTAMIHQG